MTSSVPFNALTQKHYSTTPEPCSMPFTPSFPLHLTPSPTQTMNQCHSKSSRKVKAFGLFAKKSLGGFLMASTGPLNYRLENFKSSGTPSSKCFAVDMPLAMNLNPWWASSNMRALLSPMARHSWLHCTSSCPRRMQPPKPPVENTSKSPVTQRHTLPYTTSGH